jgi:acetyl-CoA synthetase
MIRRARTPEGTKQDERWAAFAKELGRSPHPFEKQWDLYREIYTGRAESDGPPFAWQPTADIVARTHLGDCMRDHGFSDYAKLHRWSARERPEFWSTVIERLGVVFDRAPTVILDPQSDVRDPRWLPGASMNICDSCFLAPPDKAAVISGREGSRELTVTSYRDLRQMVNRVASGLARHGFSEGDRIALYMPMNLECVAAYLGIVKTGGCVVSIADSFTPAELAKRLSISDANGIVTVDAQLRGGKRVPMYEKVKEAGAPRAVVIKDRGGSEPALRHGDLSWDDLIGGGEAIGSSVGEPRRAINILFSSGTTGTPKAIPWTHLTPIKGAMDGHFHQDIHREDVVAWPTNIGWMMGPWLIFASLMNRATIALYEGAPLGAGFAEFVADAKVSVLGVVPSLVRAWRNRGFLRRKRWHDVRVFSSTGEPSNQEDYLWLMSRTDYRAPVIEYLGGTEIGGGHITGTLAQPASPATFTTPALGIDFRLLQEDATPAGVGEAGELFLVPPSIGLSQTLLNADHERAYYAECPPGPRGEVLRRHGDQFAQLGQGFYKAQGRTDDTMNLGGIKVGSLELERVLNTHQAVAECAAIGVQLGGEGAERLVVYVVGRGNREDAENLNAELRRLIADNINPLFKIHEVIPIDALPRTASNKLMRRKLQELYRERRTTST